MRRCLLACLVIVMAVAGAAPGRAQIVNGSFEPASPFGSWTTLPGGSTAIPGWTTFASGVEWFTGYALDGLYNIDLANYTSSDGGIEQTFPTTPGEVYIIEFSLGTHQTSGRDGTAEIVVGADGASQTFTAVNHSVTIAWESKSFTFTADDASATLRFRCLQNAYLHFAYLDAVGATALSTPAESKSWSEIKSLYR
ncbi:MAG: DUF642 domain-containing protein [bacterium]|nr:DUF642 domain-containing protein [bacterium]